MVADSAIALVCKKGDAIDYQGLSPFLSNIYATFYPELFSEVHPHA